VRSVAGALVVSTIFDAADSIEANTYLAKGLFTRTSHGIGRRMIIKSVAMFRLAKTRSSSEAALQSPSFVFIK
jgi:hypothetical protein